MDLRNSNLKMAMGLHLFIISLSSFVLSSSAALTDISELGGDAEFRSIKLHWKYAKNIPDAFGFIVTYCEDQAWGRYRCKDKVINKEERREVERNDNYLHFEAEIGGLRMATNYTIEVNPMHAGISRSNPQRARALGGHIVVQTKGFLARAINCLTNISLLEIETGPFFGGKISVEGTTDEGCSIQGNDKSPQTTYMLTINHQICGSEMMNASVRTFVIVQENLPILTHSTRRFMVVCNYVPETFTVRAGVHLPDYDSSPNSLRPVSHDVQEVDPSEYLDSSNSLFNSRVGKQVGRALRLSSSKEEDEGQHHHVPVMVQKDALLYKERSTGNSNIPSTLALSDMEPPDMDFLTQSIHSTVDTPEPKKWAHMVLMIVLVMSAVIGLSCAVLHFIRNSRQRNRTGFMSPQVEPSAIEINENMEAVVRDFGEDFGSDAQLSAPSPNPAALTEVDITETDDGLLLVVTPSMANNHPTTTGLLTDANDIDTILLHQELVGSPDFILSGPFGDELFVAGEPYVYSEYNTSTMSTISGQPSFIPDNHILSVPVNNLENLDIIFDDQNPYFHSDPTLLFARDADLPLQHSLYPSYPNDLTPSDSDSDTMRSSSSSCSSNDTANSSSDAISLSSSSEEDEGTARNEGRLPNGNGGRDREIPSGLNFEEAEVNSKCLSTASLGGVETNWQLMDEQGSVFPAVSV